MLLWIAAHHCDFLLIFFGKRKTVRNPWKANKRCIEYKRCTNCTVLSFKKKIIPCNKIGNLIKQYLKHWSWQHSVLFLMCDNDFNDRAIELNENKEIINNTNDQLKWLCINWRLEQNTLHILNWLRIETGSIWLIFI